MKVRSWDHRASVAGGHAEAQTLFARRCSQLPAARQNETATQMSLRHDVVVDVGRGKKAGGDQPAISAELSNEIAEIIGSVTRWADDRRGG